jgi:hypothetical protein
VDRIRQIPEFHGLVWRKNRPVQPVYFEPYMDNAAQRRVAREDPYHRGGGTTGAGTAEAGPRVHGYGAGVAVSFGIGLMLLLSLLGVM